jgi:SAM-dependent methyltransferase
VVRPLPAVVSDRPLPRRFFEIAEREHELQNPTSTEKIRLLGEWLRLSDGSRVLDIASGRGGPALILVQEFGCHVTAFELREEFVAAAAERFAAAGLEQRIELVQADARDAPLETAAYDVAMCLGASFVWGGLEQTLAALIPTVRAGGHVAVGEPYRRSSSAADEFVPLEETADRFSRAGLALVGLIASSEDDWDRYESLHWRAFEEGLAENPDAADAAEIRARHVESRERYLRSQREGLGWAIFVARKP